MPAMSPVSTQMLGTFQPRPQNLDTPDSVREQDQEGQEQDQEGQEEVRIPQKSLVTSDPMGGFKVPDNWTAPDPYSALNYQTFQKGTTAWRSGSHLPWSAQTKGSFFNF